MAEIQVTRSFQALWDNRTPFVVLEGSSRSGKTWAICQWLAQQCAKERVKVFACRNDGATCERTIVPDFKGVMAQLGCWDRGCWNETLKRYTWPNGSVLEFGGTQDISKLHGLRCDILWCNEAMEITYEAWSQLTIRCTKLRIIDFNPSLVHHWVFDRIMSRPAGEYTYCHTTYRDNPFLTATQVGEIESWEPTPRNVAAGTADKWRWTVYGLGRRGRREGTVYELWELTEDWPDRMLCQRHGYGLDFGYSMDPTALVECAVFQDRLYLRERIYEQNLLVVESPDEPGRPSIQGRLRELGVGRSKVYADSADPEAIASLVARGFNVVGAPKGPNSIQAGIQLLRGRRMQVSRDSQNLQRELEQYVWHRDRATGNWTDSPEDAWNHGLDAARYWALVELRPRPDDNGRVRRPTQAQTVLKRW